MKLQPTLIKLHCIAISHMKSIPLFCARLCYSKCTIHVPFGADSRLLSDHIPFMLVRFVSPSPVNHVDLISIVVNSPLTASHTLTLHQALDGLGDIPFLNPLLSPIFLAFLKNFSTSLFIVAWKDNYNTILKQVSHILLMQRLNIDKISVFFHSISSKKVLVWLNLKDQL